MSSRGVLKTADDYVDKFVPDVTPEIYEKMTDVWFPIGQSLVVAFATIAVSIASIKTKFL